MHTAINNHHQIFWLNLINFCYQKLFPGWFNFSVSTAWAGWPLCDIEYVVELLSEWCYTGNMVPSCQLICSSHLAQTKYYKPLSAQTECHILHAEEMHKSLKTLPARLWKNSQQHNQLEEMTWASNITSEIYYYGLPYRLYQWLPTPIYLCISFVPFRRFIIFCQFWFWSMTKFTLWIWIIHILIIITVFY